MARLFNTFKSVAAVTGKVSGLIVSMSLPRRNKPIKNDQYHLRSDEEALRSDWERIGLDMKKAVLTYDAGKK